MKDQADTLRKLMRERAAGGAELPAYEAVAKRPPAARVMTLSSGKGGVGKTCLAANLGALLARSGLRVLLVDGDFGLANLDIVLGVQPQATIEEVLHGEASLQDALAGVEPNLWLMPASSGLMDYREADAATRARVTGVLANFPWDMDVVLMDLGAGIQSNVLSMHAPIYDSLVVVTPEPTSITDAYGLVKLLRRHSGISQFGVIVNQVTHPEEARAAFKKLKEVADRFLDVGLEYLGHCERDENFTRSVRNRKILLDLNSEAPSIPSLELLAKRLSGKIGPKMAEFLPINQAPEARQGMALTRTHDEPGREMPGNTARFWRTLLGEVKA